MDEALIQANTTIQLLERQLRELGQAEGHPRYSVTGEIVMLGDIAQMGADLVEQRVLAMHALPDDVATIITEDPAAPWPQTAWQFTEARVLVGRQRLPKKTERENPNPAL